MSQVVKLETNSYVGFLIGIGAWSITFITLIWGYISYRLRAGAWMQVYIDERIFSITIFNTVVLLLSSLVLRVFIQKKRVAFLVAGLLAGMIFLAGQVHLWKIFVAQGLTLQSSLAGSFLYLLTGFHAAHIVIGIGILLPFGIQMLRLMTAKSENHFSFALMFWDLLTIFWCVLFLVIFILK